MKKILKLFFLLLIFATAHGFAQQVPPNASPDSSESLLAGSPILKSDYTMGFPSVQKSQTVWTNIWSDCQWFFSQLRYSVKTNIVGWTGLTPEFRYTLPTPNLSAEVFFLERWSAEFGFAFANFDYGTNKHWGVSGYRIEPRFWLKKDDHFEGWNFGLYTQLGDFDTQGIRSGNYTGTYVQVGVSAGYLWQLTQHLGCEVGLRAGYQNANVTQYDIELGHNYRHTGGNVDGDRFGLTGINAGLSWRF